MVSHVHISASSVSATAVNPVHEAACIDRAEEYIPPDIFFMPVDAYHDWIASLKAEIDAAKKAAETVK